MLCISFAFKFMGHGPTNLLVYLDFSSLPFKIRMDFLFPRDFSPFGLSGVSVRAIGLLSSFVLARSTRLRDFRLLRLFRRVGPRKLER